MMTLTELEMEDSEAPQRRRIRMLTPKMVSQELNIGITNTYKLFKLKGFPKIQIGRKMFVEEEDLKKFLDEHKKCKIYLE